MSIQQTNLFSAVSIHVPPLNNLCISVCLHTYSMTRDDKVLLFINLSQIYFGNSLGLIWKVQEAWGLERVTIVYMHVYTVHWPGRTPVGMLHASLSSGGCR